MKRIRTLNPPLARSTKRVEKTCMGSGFMSIVDE